jgi:hypothetical protein
MLLDGLQIMRELEAPAEDIEQAEAVIEAERVDEDFEVHADNWVTVTTLNRLGTQWQYQAVGGGMESAPEVRRVRMVYEGCESAMRGMRGLRGAPSWRSLFDELQMWEEAVLAADHEMRQQRRS